MRVKRIYPRQLHTEIEMSQEEVEMLLDFLDSCSLDFLGSDRLKKAGEYVTTKFFPNLQRLSEEMRSIS